MICSESLSDREGCTLGANQLSSGASAPMAPPLYALTKTRIPYKWKSLIMQLFVTEAAV